MQTALRHRQTKGAETDMLSLTPPRHTSTLRSPDGWNGYPCVDRRIGIDRGERLIEVRLSREGRREEAHDLFDAYLPPVSYEQQQGVGVHADCWDASRPGQDRGDRSTRSDRGSQSLRRQRNDRPWRTRAAAPVLNGRYRVGRPMSLTKPVPISQPGGDVVCVGAPR